MTRRTRAGADRRGTNELDAMLASASFAMDTAATAQVLITIAGRFGRVSWKYSSLAYSLVLKNVGALTKRFTSWQRIWGSADARSGAIDIELFAKMTGLEFHTEGAVGQFAMGRRCKTKLCPALAISASAASHREPWTWLVFREQGTCLQRHQSDRIGLGRPPQRDSSV